MIFIFVGSMVEWLERRHRDQHGLGSKPIHAILLCPSERKFAAFSLLGVLASSFKLHSYLYEFLGNINILASRKQIGVIAYPMY